MRETWYVLEDDTTADPRDVEQDAAGVLRYKDGRAVAMGPYGPRSRGVDVSARAAEAPANREVTAEKPRRGYKTRGV